MASGEIFNVTLTTSGLSNPLLGYPFLGHGLNGRNSYIFNAAESRIQHNKKVCYYLRKTPHH